ncbi:protein TolQ [Caulobacter segnis]|uniref:protein TolQ n=1 Tax=Caulobacter segnis TaxID=88688 RepID=UPI00240FC1FB|nr:protein TolQ [Caulobacter segnis]MDG2520918.1 protein TolQ [Caulobacter segnis]
MDAAAAADFSFLHLFMQADWIIKLVMIGLGVASLWSWAVILDKTFKFTALNREADRFEDKVAGGRSLEDVAAEAGSNPSHALPKMLVAALKEWRDARAKGRLDDAQTAMLITRIDRTLDNTIARETSKAEDGLGLLAIVATASPFIGLFGTVWGIMSAFQSIAAEKNTSLAVVAPAIAEALFATAIGLIAAIPAYIAYNKFSTDAAKFGGRLENFADDLSTAIQRRLAER